MKLPLRSAAASTAMLALLAAALLIWAPPVLAVGTPAAEETDLAARSRALQRARQAVLGVQAQAVDQARSARTLGSERTGSGVVIGRDGLVLTIGYLLLEAEAVQLLHDDGRSVPARVVGYDLASGLGLLQALAPLALEPVPLGRPETLATAAPLMVASGGLGAAVSVTELVARRAFAGYWEYHIDGALFTSPPRGDHSGAGLFNAAGELVGIGSLLLADVTPDSPQPRRPGNMFVPVNLLPTGLADLPTRGFGPPVPRAWLGLNCAESAGRLRVLRVTTDSPADVAGLEAGDQILRIDGTAVQTLAALWQALWTGGAAERAVTLAIERDGQPRSLTIYSVDRLKTLRRPEGI